MKRVLLLTLIAAGLLSCKSAGEKEAITTVSGLNTKDFVATVQGKQTGLYVLRNATGLEACITNYGGRLVSLLVADRTGNLRDVVLGYGSIDEYLASDGNFGALIGRYGNRIKDGRFTLDGKEYQLPQNNFGHCLHGGPKGFHTRVWDAEKVDAQTLKLHYVSKDGEEGFPGKLDVTVTYKLTDDNAIDIQYEATTNKPTVVNLTNHSYFNLSGVPGSQILDHLIMINADSYTAVDSLLIPFEIVPVEGTPLDLRNLQPIGKKMNDLLTISSIRLLQRNPPPVGQKIEDHINQMMKGHGYDYNWILNTKGDIKLLAAKAVSPVSGIVLEVYTNEPGVQFYTGNFMDGKDKGKSGTVYPHRGAFCLETQHYPDSPNQSGFPAGSAPSGRKICQ